MRAKNIPTIDLEEVMEKIRAEINKKDMTQQSSNSFSNLPRSEQKFLDLKTFPRTPPFETKARGYHIHDFLKFHGGEFVNNAYLGILRREPDPQGYGFYLHKLRTGEISKVDILGRLRFSSEGRAKSVRIKGLSHNFLLRNIFKIPIIGYFSRLFVGILNLPAIIKNFERFETFVQSRFTEFQNHDSNNIEIIRKRVTEMSDQLSTVSDLQYAIQRTEALELELIELQNSVYQKADRRDLEDVASDKADRLELNRIAEMKADISVFEDLRLAKADKIEIIDLASKFTDLKQNLNYLRIAVTEMERFLTDLVERHLNDRGVANKLALDQQSQSLLLEPDHLLDYLYVSFEESFRGTRADIKNRIEVYLPYVRKVGAGSADSPILDLGCGRGEWLEFCHEENLMARGIDSNRIMVELSRALGLDVIEADLLDYLRMHGTNNFGAITAFHIAEHLSFGQLIAFFDGAFRALKPGGMLIVETPNPDNIVVACRNFYQDPTHRNPLPNSTLAFIAKARGFADLEILPLNPVPESARDPAVTGKLSDLIYGPQDYALIGQKPS